MRTRTENTICITVLAVILIAIITGIAGSRKVMSRKHCCGITVQVMDSVQNKFTDQSSIIRIINRDFGGYRNRLCDSVNLFKLENVLTCLPYIRSGEAYFTNDGMLHIDIRQQDPCFKLKCGGQMYYACPNCQYVKVSRDWCDGIPGINGTANQLGDRKWTALACSGAGWIASEKKWAERVGGMTCDEKGEIILKISGRGENFIIGVPDEMEKKFDRIETYLTRIAPGAEANGLKYKYVNVKYKGQIVCK